MLEQHHAFHENIERKRSIIERLCSEIPSTPRLQWFFYTFSYEVLEELYDLLLYNPKPEEIAYPVQWLISGTLSLEFQSVSVLNPDTFRELLAPCLPQLITFFRAHPEFNGSFGYLLSLFPAKTLAEYHISPLPTRIEKTKLELHASKSGWYLCPTSEHKLLQSLDNGTVMLVNGKLLLKFMGKLTAYCLEDFVSASGYAFHQGFWYSPEPGLIRSYLRKQFLLGKTEVTIQKSNWVYMRPAEQNVSYVTDLVNGEAMFAFDKLNLKEWYSLVKVRRSVQRILKAQKDTVVFHSMIIDALPKIPSQVSKRKQVIEETMR